MDELIAELEDKIEVEVTNDSAKENPCTTEIEGEVKGEVKGEVEGEVKPEAPVNDTSTVIEVSSNENSNQIKSKKKSKRDRAIQQYQEQMAQKMNSEQGNKYYRNFMKDLRSKFTLIEQTDYRYFEVKSNQTDMVIDGARVYKLAMPECTDNTKGKGTYFLILGDLTMKSGLIKQIDPSYHADKVIKSQNEFLERIKAKENSKITAMEADLIEDEFNDKDMLGISEEKLSKSNNESDESDDEMPALEPINSAIIKV
jgi:hypothetical protein